MSFDGFAFLFEIPQNRRFLFSFFKRPAMMADLIQFRFFFDGNAGQDEILRSPLGSLNKVGHALHMQPVTDPQIRYSHVMQFFIRLKGVFQNMVQSDRVKAVLKELDYTNVSIPQSMYIFKQAGFGRN